MLYYAGCLLDLFVPQRIVSRFIRYVINGKSVIKIEKYKFS